MVLDAYFLGGRGGEQIGNRWREQGKMCLNECERHMERLAGKTVWDVCVSEEEKKEKHVPGCGCVRTMDGRKKAQLFLLVLI